MLRETPEKAWLTKGSGEGKTPLNAFDNALIDAGIGNLNLVSISSVLPSKIEITNEKPDYDPGTIIPSIYTKITSEKKQITSSIGIGIGKNLGLVYEYSKENKSKKHTEKKVINMVKEGFKSRKKELMKTRTLSITKEPKGKYNSTVAAVIF